MQSGLPDDAASLRETGSVDRYIYTAWARVPSNGIANCGAVSCLINALADGTAYRGFALINPRRACATRVTVLGLSVCLFVRRLTNLGTGRPMTAMNRFFLKRLRSRDMA